MISPLWTELFLCAPMRQNPKPRMRDTPLPYKEGGTRGFVWFAVQNLNFEMGGTKNNGK